jgi:hypothetical protein
MGPVQPIHNRQTVEQTSNEKFTIDRAKPPVRRGFAIASAFDVSRHGVASKRHTCRERLTRSPCRQARPRILEK